MTFDEHAKCVAVALPGKIDRRFIGPFHPATRLDYGLARALGGILGAVRLFYNWSGEVAMSQWQPAAYKDYQWIVADPQLLGGKLAVRGTRLAVSLVLECLAGGMSLEDIDQAFDFEFPRPALPEILKVASEFTDSFHVAA